jgi:hypothetical protein
VDTDARYTWYWRRTKYGPLAEPLQGRKGEECRVFVRGADGKIGVEFADGYRVVALRRAVRRLKPGGETP